MNNNKKKLLLDVMIKEQHKLNITTCGDNYLSSGRTDLDKKIRWGLCIAMEMAELIDSGPWKHWKFSSAKPDSLNMMVEVVDIGHFMFSHLLEVLNKEISFMANNQLSIPGLEDIAFTNPVTMLIELLTNSSFSYEFEFSKLPDNQLDRILFLKDWITLDMTLENVGRYPIQSQLKRSCTYEPMHSTKYAQVQWGRLMSMFELVDINTKYKLDPLENFYLCYLAKNALNRVRQDFGYDDGTYIKVYKINDMDVEDNVIMFTRVLNKIFNKVSTGELDIIDIKIHTIYTSYLEYMKLKNLAIQK